MNLVWLAAALWVTQFLSHIKNVSQLHCIKPPALVVSDDFSLSATWLTWLALPCSYYPHRYTWRQPTSGFWSSHSERCSSRLWGPACGFYRWRRTHAQLTGSGFPLTSHIRWILLRLLWYHMESELYPGTFEWGQKRSRALEPPSIHSPEL